MRPRCAAPGTRTRINYAGSTHVYREERIFVIGIRGGLFVFGCSGEKEREMIFIGEPEVIHGSTVMANLFIGRTGILGDGGGGWALWVRGISRGAVVAGREKKRGEVIRSVNDGIFMIV